LAFFLMASSLLFSESAPAQANIIRRLRPSVFSTAASPPAATVSLSSFVIGAITTLGLAFLRLRSWLKRPEGGGGLGVADRDWEVSPSLVNSALEGILAVL